jgi:hypothetical protein
VPKGLPQNVKDNVEKCRSAAIAAVEAYNRPGTRFRTAQFLVLVVIAWTALFHAIFYRKGRRPWYRQKSSASGTGVRYVKIDGDPKHWDLMECLRQHFADQNPPERKNVEFLIGLRNKIEHRNLPQFDASLYGECQASLLNLEQLLVMSFGPKYGLADQLAIALQFSQLVPEEKSKATKSAVLTASKGVVDYIEKFRAGLPAATLSSMKYSFAVFLVPKVANRASAADVAVQFVRVDEASAEELARLEKLNVLIREKHIPIANLGLFKPGDVVKKLRTALPWRVSMSTHTRAWRHFGIRPPSGAAGADKTDGRYCVYDSVHADYVYTQAWIDKLIGDLTEAANFEAISGTPPIAK